MTAERWLEFGGVDLRRLALIAGSTPFYAYSREALVANVDRLRSAFPEGISFHYSLKANHWEPVVFTMAPHVDGFDVSSESELKTALGTGKPAHRVQLSGPGKSVRALRCAIGAGALISVESPIELGRIKQIAREVGVPADVILRVNPDFELRGVGMRMGGVARQFGVDCEACPAVLQEMGGDMIRFRGLHVYWGSQCLRAETIAQAHQGCIAIVERLTRYFPQPPQILNFGGGFGIPYTVEDRPLAIEDIGRAAEQWWPAVRAAHPEAQLVFELGRYLAGPAGIYVCRVIDKKVSKGETFLVTDGGMHQQLAASGNLGQVVKRNYPMTIGNRVGLGPPETVSVSGCLCTPIDMLGSHVDLPRAEIGDYVVIFQSGAYGKSASPLGFLGHPEPAEILI